ncbi:MAG: isoquinoline 1-oxidoreductase, partial [Bacteroidetes bacterium]
MKEKRIKKHVIPETSVRSKHRLDIVRRDFFKLLGGGIVISFGTGNPSELLAMPMALRRERPTDYNAFLRTGDDNKVTCYVGKIEMGQGPVTSLPQQVADELDVTYESIRMVMGDTLLCPYDEGTWGSLTTMEFSHSLRAAAAEARAVLMQLASEHLGMLLEDLDVKEGLVFSTTNPEKKVTYGELTKGKYIERFVDEKPRVKDHTEFRYVGMPMHRSDALLKVTGQAKYTADLKEPGMVYARILRTPSHLAKLVSADTSEAEKMEGVEVVRDGDLVAVLHPMPDMAAAAIVRVKAEYSFEDEKEVNDQTVFEYLLNAPSQGREVNRSGDLAEGEKASDTIVESEFHDGYVAHSPIEPHAALATWEGGRLTVWASSQTPFGSQDDLARELGMELENVRVIPPFLGGGFGGKIYNPQVVEAARVARLAGKPVMLNYTREEEFFMDYFRPAAVVKIRSGFNQTGRITLWDFKVYFAGSRGSNTIYDVPHSLTTSYDEKRGSPVHPFPTGAWRAPANNTNTFARESQVDIMASAAGIDPLQFRLDNLDDEKMIAVWKAAAEKFGYTPAVAPSGRGIGMACGTDAGTWVAAIAEVQVDKETGEVHPVRVVYAQDMGLCVNPQGSVIQVEGGITMGLGYALMEDVEFSGGKVITRNFDTYRLPLFNQAPQIETVILDRLDQPPQ